MAFLRDGFRTKIDIAGFAGGFLEKEVQPPAMDSMGAIDTSTMRNNSFHTKWPKGLVNTDDITLQVNYDPVLYSSLAIYMALSPLARIRSMTVTFPDGSTINFYAWIDKFTPAALKEGEFPLAEMKIILSNTNALGTENSNVFGYQPPGTPYP